MSKIKICGLRSLEDITAANLYQPDFVGFVFSQSKRQVQKEQAALLKANLSKNILAVGVFVNEPADTVCSLAKAGVMDWIQLHGDEDASYIAQIKKRTGCSVIKAIRVRCQADILQAQALPCDFLLFDTYRVKSYGGTGTRFDWKLIPPHCTKPFFLAGGLNSSCIVQAVQTVSPNCVDVSSGVETNGQKDPTKMEEIIRLVRSAEYEQR